MESAFGVDHGLISKLSGYDYPDKNLGRVTANRVGYLTVPGKSPSTAKKVGEQKKKSHQQSRSRAGGILGASAGGLVGSARGGKGAAVGAVLGGAGGGTAGYFGSSRKAKKIGASAESRARKPSHKEVWEHSSGGKVHRTSVDDFSGSERHLKPGESYTRFSRGPKGEYNKTKHVIKRLGA